MSRYKPYPGHKDSRVEWIEQIPEHWETKPIKRIVTCNDDSLDEQFDPTSTIKYVDISSVSLTEGIGRSEKILFSDAPSRARRKAKEGDVVISTVRTYLKAVAQVSEQHADCVFSTGFAVLRAKKQFVYPPFLKWFSLNELLIQSIECNSKGLSYPAINASELVDLPSVLPSEEEQKIIAEVLDKETNRIDALIAKKTRFVELLKEKRQALITHAVTKGLDPNVKMKDSGVEWIGEVPEHWGVGPLKHWFSTTSGATPHTSKQDLYYDNENGIPWIRTTDLTNGVIDSYEIGITEKAIEDTACKVLPVNSVLLAMYGGAGTIGKNGKLNITACINQAVCALLPSKKFDPDFTFFYIQFYRPYWMIGAVSTRKDPNISQDLVKETVIPRPPLSEQKAIADFLDFELKRIGLLESKTQLSIDLLKERRSAFITAAVTGQIDLRSEVNQ